MNISRYTSRFGGARVAALQIAAVVVILLIGAAVVTALIMMREDQPRDQAEKPRPAVQTMTVEHVDAPLTIEGFGDVEPRVQIDVVPQVAGRVVSVHPNLVDGGFIDAGEPLVQLERDDYEIAVKRSEARLEQARGGLASAHSGVEAAEGAIGQADAAIAQARTRLATERAEAEAALAEWRSLHGDRDAPPLLVREPQIREAEAALQSAEAQKRAAEAQKQAAEAQLIAAQADIQSAEAAVREANLNLARTTITVPFAGRVLSESIDEGQFVTAGQRLATVYGTAMMQVTVPLSDDQLAWLDLPLIPRANDPTAPTPERGVPVAINTQFAGQEARWRGLAVRTTGQIDPQSRLVHVVVEVPEPFTQGPIPLTPGMFVDVGFEGRTLQDVAIVPRRAVRQDQTVWVANGDRLEVRPVEIHHMDIDSAYISDGLQPGDEVIVTSLDVVADGMHVRVRPMGETDQTAEAPPTIAPAAFTSGDGRQPQ